MGARAHLLQGGEKIWGTKFTGESCKCTPRQSKSPIFEKIGEMWTVGVDNLVLLACLLRATIKKRKKKKRSSTLSRKKSAPLQRNFWLRVCCTVQWLKETAQQNL